MKSLQVIKQTCLPREMKKVAFKFNKKKLTESGSLLFKYIQPKTIQSNPIRFEGSEVFAKIFTKKNVPLPCIINLQKKVTYIS